MRNCPDQSIIFQGPFLSRVVLQESRDSARSTGTGKSPFVRSKAWVCLGMAVAAAMVSLIL